MRLLILTLMFTQAVAVTASVFAKLTEIKWKHAPNVDSPDRLGRRSTSVA